jgi:hypothetical protein
VRLVAALVLLVACGRIDFDPLPGSGSVFTSFALPSGGDAHAIARASDGTLYASFAEARVVRSSDNGGSWTDCGVATIEPENLMVDPATGAVYLGWDDAGKIEVSNDGCATWTDLGAPEFRGGLAMLRGDLVAGGSTGVWRLHGSAWTRMMTPLDGNQVHNIVFDEMGVRGFVTAANGMVCSSDSETTWSTNCALGLPGPGIDFVVPDPVRSTHLFAQSSGALFYSVDTATTWTATTSGGSALAIDPSAPDFVVFGSYDDGIIESTDGMTFDTTDRRTSDMYTTLTNELLFGPTSDVLAATNRGIFYAPDHSLQWVERDGTLSAWSIDSIAIDGLGELVLATPAGVLVSGDGGASWNEYSAGLSPDSRTTSLAQPAAAPGALLTATMAQLTRSDDHGHSYYTLWTAPDPDGKTCNSVREAGDHLIVATAGGVATSDSMWSTFTHHDVGSPSQYVNDVLAIDTAGTQLVAGTSQGVWYSSDGGATFAMVGLPNENVVRLAVLDSGVLLAGARDGAFIAPAPGGPWTLTTLSATYVTDLLVAQGVVVAASSTGVWISHDDAATWALVPGLETRSPSALALDASRRLYVGTHGYGLFSTMLQ